MGGNIDLQTLIHTKFHCPHVPNGMIVRPRLLELLNARRPLTLLAAPAGYGKTTLLSAWLNRVECPTLWLTLDSKDSELALFVTYFVAALQSQFPHVGQETLALVSGSVEPPVAVIARTLANEMDAIQQPFIFVLDDYHLITGTAVHVLLSETLRHPPVSLHLAIATRHDPPLGLPILRARDQLTELRYRDLRFTEEETGQYLRHVLSRAVNQETVDALATKMEGWIAGLHLTALYLHNQKDANVAAAYLRDSNRYVMDFLSAEVLQKQTPSLQDYLVKTSILNRMCGPLCDAVVEAPEPGKGQLQWLEMNNLFVYSLDDEGCWYRYHHLFQRLLQHRLQESLSSAEIAGLHLRASQWFSSQGLTEEALHHALAGNDIAGAVELVARQRHHLMDREEWRVLQRWLRLFDREVIDSQPDLLLAEAWLMMSQGRAEAYPEIIERIDDLRTKSAPEPLPSSTCDVEVLRCELLYYIGRPEEVIRLGHQTLAVIPHTWQLARSYLILVLAGAHQMVGDLASAYRVLADGLREPVTFPQISHARILVGQCLVQWLAADLPGMLQTAQRALGLSEELQLAETRGWAQYFAAKVYYHWNELEKAEEYLLAVLRHPYAVHGNTFGDASCALALVYQAQGLADKARATIDAALQFFVETDLTWQDNLQVFQAELALRQGDMTEAVRWAAQHSAPIPLAPVVDFFAPQLTRPKILLAHGTPAARHEAAQLLAEAHDYYCAIHSTRFLIEVLALQAILFKAEGNVRRARESLEEALTLAQPGGMVRIFADLGSGLEPLLAQLAGRGVQPTFVAQIRAAIKQNVVAPEIVLAPTRPKPAQSESISRRESHPNLLEALTPREREVLTLLGQRLTNKEIAYILGVSGDTVKQHIKSVFGKLHVEGRRQAVTQARALGLLN